MSYQLKLNGKIWNTINGKTIRNLIYNGTVYEITKFEPKILPGCLTFSSAKSSFNLTLGENANYNGSLEYSTNGETWLTLNKGDTVKSVKQHIYIRGSNNTYCKGYYNYDGKHQVFILEGSDIRCDGNVETLLDYQTVLNGQHPTMASACFSYLFMFCDALISPPELPAINLSDECYLYMFYSCPNLRTAPTLPATTLKPSCYSRMFSGCTSLKEAPELLATNLAMSCYKMMFESCINLVKAPALPATTLAIYCYEYMFSGCKSLTTAPELPATTLAMYCYESMFSGCTNLTQAPSLPATTLASYCYAYMFQGCSHLTSAPELPVTKLAQYCYRNMFTGCKSLTTAPILPATTLTDFCYTEMFRGCTNLTQAPSLPATTLAKECYRGMFASCTSLTTTPKLPVTTLTEKCYQEMFSGCKNLTQIPILPATTLANYCYNKMFYNCSKIKFSSTPTEDYVNEYRIPSGTATGTIATNALTDMFKNTGGTFTGTPEINTTYYTSNEIVEVPAPAPTPVEIGYLTFSSDNSFTLTINSKTTYEGSLQYSADTITWTDVIKGTAISSVNNKIYLRGSGNSCFGQSGGTSLISKILLTGSNVKCDGNIETLLDYQTVLKGEHPTMANECFEGMFQSCTSLITAPSLPATKLSDLCYRAMFNKCSNLTTAPALPATILTKQCYEYMFQSCTSLTQLPALRATDLKPSCYYYMFYKCSKIKLSTTKTGEYVNEYRIPYGTNIGTRASNCEISMFESTGGQTIYATINGSSFKGTPKINTTYYTSNEVIQ